MNKSSLSVSWHPTAKQFVRYVGQAIGRDGSPKPKSFYLGTDEPTALAVAARLRSDWAALKTSGATAWPTTYLDAFNRGKNIRDATVGKLMTGQSVAVAMATETVADVRTAYLAEQKQRMEAKQITAVSYHNLAWRLGIALDRLPPSLSIADKSVRSIGEQELRAVILHWASLPIGKVSNQTKRPTTGKWVGYKRQNQTTRVKRTHGKAIGAAYAKNLIAVLKMLFTWSHETERWDMPRRFAKLFKMKFAARHIEAERFTLDELSSLYTACKSDRHRLWIMLGLNAGLDRTGLATLEWSMIKGLDTDAPMIERLRHKTGVYSRHPLWIETADLLRAVPKAERQGIVCLTERGETLVGLKRDGVHSAWRHLVVAAETRQLSYGKLRKTGAWIIKTIGGLEVSEMYLAHGEAGMNKHYAGRDWEKLDTALATMREQLAPMLPQTV